MPRHYISYCRFTYLLLLRINTQKQPDKKKSSAIVKYKAGNGISPALRKLSLLISAICTYERNVSSAWWIFKSPIRPPVKLTVKSTSSGSLLLL